jgi:hypothetical protein
MRRTLNTVTLVVILSSFLLIVPPDRVQAQTMVVTAFAPVQPTVAWMPVRQGLFGLRRGFVPVISQPTAVSFMSPVTVARPVFVSQPVAMSRPFIVAQPAVVSRPVAVPTCACRPVISAPVTVSRPVIVNRPVTTVFSSSPTTVWMPAW